MSGTEKAMQGVADTLREFWAHRPVRPRAGRKLGGVATGIALRYQIDPVIVRIAFVALALSGGVGLPMYLAGWLLLPEEGDQASPLESLLNRGHSSTSQGQTVLLGVLMFPALAFTFGSGGFQVFVTIAASVACIYLLQKNRGHLQPATTLADPPPTPPVPGAPAWDPLGAAPFAWDLPEPTPKPQPPAPRPRKPRVSGVTLGVALLVGAAAAIAGTWIPWFTAPHVVGLVIAVLAAGLLVGAFTGGGRGLIWLLVPLSVVGFGLTSVKFEGPANVGDLNFTPRSVGEVESRYELGVGSLVLDLRELPDSGAVKTQVESNLGEVLVHVPANADVTFRCEADSIGELDCLGKRADGTGVQVDGTDLGADGEGGLKIDLDVLTSVGEVRVLRD
ncbi:PspC domain-containing protein [Lentzea albida]|nr:PspC domain-containing protein [Lentzea albida]